MSRCFWEAVSKLSVQGWKLDDCIHDATVRNELASSLAPRPFAPRALGFGNGKGRGFNLNSDRGGRRSQRCP